MNVFLAVLTGLLFSAGFAPLEIWVAPYLAIALFFRILIERELPERILYSVITGLAFFLPLLHWSSVYVGSVPWLVLAIGESLIFAAIGMVRWQRRWESAFLFATLFTAIELVRMKWPFGGFGWGRLGFTQVDSLTWLYPTIGVTGISLFIAFSTFLIFSIRKTVLFALPILASSFILSANFASDVSFKTVQITAVQGGVDELGLNFNNRAIRVLQRHIEATPNVPGTDLYVWPENASDVDPLRNEQARSLITNLLVEIKTPLLVGAVERTPEGPSNSSLLYGADGKVSSRYVKQDLAPFGEYMPVRAVAEAISPYAQQVNDFVPGKKWIPHSINGLPFQSLICFEVLDDDHVKAGTRGTAFLVAQTNNATFGRSHEAAQQLQITRSRAAESAREFVVVSTTGLTSHLDTRGKITAIAPQFTAENLTVKVKATNPGKETPAQRLTTWIWALILGLSAAVIGLRLNR